MLVVYDKSDGKIISISGYSAPFTKEAVDSIALAEPLAPEHAEYRIYDEETARRIWNALEQGCVITVIVDADGNPKGIHIDGNYQEPQELPPLPTLEERVAALEELELERLFGDGVE